MNIWGWTLSNLHTFGLFAQAAPSTNPISDPWTPILNLGVGGVFIVLILIGRLWTKGSYDELKADRDAWKMAHDAQRERADRSDAVVAKFANEGEITNRILTELKTSPRKPR